MTEGRNNTGTGMRKVRGIFSRSFGFMLAVSLTVTLLFVIAVLPREKSALLDAMGAQAKSLAASIAGVCANALFVGDNSFIVEHNMQVIQSSSDIVYIIVARSDGFSLVHGAEQWQQQDKADPAWAVAQKDGPSGEIRRNMTADGEVYHYSYPLVFSGVEWGTLYLGLSLEKYRSGLMTMYTSIFVISLVSLLFSAFLSYIFAGQLTKPIRTLRRITQEIAGGNLEARVEVRSGDEVSDLAESFNRMADTLLQSQKEMEIARKAAEEANLAKSQFLVNMSHEIRTPLSGILGMTELLAETPLTDKQQEYLKNIDFSGFTLLGLINDLLDFSKIEAGKLQLVMENFDVRVAAENVVALFWEQARRKGIMLDFVMEPDHPVMAVGDAFRLRQILMNLIGNAFKFTEKGSIHVRVSCREDDRSVLNLKFEVADTGVGIAEEDRERIFESFTQADGSLSRRFGGTGLGLTISRHLVGLMNGSIGVESSPGKGSLFWFSVSLPKGQAGVPETTAPVAILHQRKFSGRALLAEDNEVNRIVATEMLSRFGLEVDTAENGREALDSLKTGTYDVVFMDCQMPEMDGFDATKKFREYELSSSDGGRQKLKPTVIIALTAHILQGYRQKCLDAGMDDYLAKPFTRESIGRVLERWLPGLDAAPSGEVRSSGYGQEAAGAARSDSPLDHAKLDEIRVLQNRSGSDIFDRVLSAYLNDSPLLLQKMREAVASGDSAGLKTAAHTLKSSSSIVGAMALADLCRDIETVAERDVWAEAAAPLLVQADAEQSAVQQALSVERERVQVV